MIKTTPPREGSRLLRMREDNPVYEACARAVELRFDITFLVAEPTRKGVSVYRQ